MDFLGRHRIAFNNIGVQLFGDLERDLESALKKGAEEKAELERVVNDQKKLLEERDTRVQQAAKIREQKKKIDELNLELAEALVENERLEGLLNPKKLDKGIQRTALGTPLDKSLQNKENIPPAFNYLAPGVSRIPTSNRPVSLPPKSPRKPSMRSSPSNDHGVQTELLGQQDREAQTDSNPVPEDLRGIYHDLAARYDVLRDELNTYKSAHEELQEKYLKNKKVWEAWTKTDAERREQSKKRRRDGSIMSESRGRHIIHGYTTPARSIADQSPYSRPPPPTLSPNKPKFESPVSHIAPEKRGLFASFKKLAKASASGDTGDTGNTGADVGTLTSARQIGTEGTTVLQGVHPRAADSEKNSWSSSISETPASPTAVADAGSVFRKDSKSPLATNTIEYINNVTDSKSAGSRSSSITPKAKLSNNSRPRKEGPSVLPPHIDRAFKVPKIKEEKLDTKRTRPGDSATRPVFIKSEPSATSSEGFGYHLFEEESLDLDDIGYKPDTPRKRQKTYRPPTEEPSSSGSSGRVGWVNGGFTIKRAPGIEETQSPDENVIEETQDEDEGLMFNEEEFSIPAFPPLAMNREEFGGIRTDSQLERPQTSPRAATVTPVKSPKQKSTTTSLKKRTNRVAEDKENQSDSRISPPPLGNWLTSASARLPNPTSTRRDIPAPQEPIPRRLSPQKPRDRRRITSTDAIAGITEDGTDGIGDIDSDDEFFPHPPMTLTENQQKRLESTERLSDILNSHAPRTPNLACLKKKTEVSKSVPAKKFVGKTFENTSSSEPPKRRAWIDPMRYTKGRQAGREPRDLSKLDISHFRVNPDMNEGRDYAFAETVRSREARKCLPGCAKACCKELAGFVEAAGLPPPAPRGPRWRSSSPPASPDETRGREEREPLDKAFTARFGKHRDAFARRRSPPGFWDADFPDTQDIIKQNEAAEEARMQKVEEMRREAEKGGKGRYVYKD